MTQTNEPPEGYARTWVPAREIPSDLAWDVITPETSKQCRWTDHGVRCEARSVVRMNRARRKDSSPQWWHYCERHMFGRRLINGEVYTQILTEVDYPPVVR